MSPSRKKQKLRDGSGRFVKANTQLEQVYDPPMEPAIERVLGTTELLESILQHLPMRTLLLGTRVSKTWHATINSSLLLRRCLFLEPVACGAISYLDWRYDDKDMYSNTLDLGEHLRGPKRRERPKMYPRHWGKARDDAGKFRVFVNPLLEEIFPVLKQDGMYWKEFYTDLPIAAQYPLASWKKMFFTQPPVASMIIEWDSGPDPEISSDDGNEDDEDSNDVNDNPIPAAPTNTPPISALPAMPNTLTQLPGQTQQAPPPATNNFPTNDSGDEVEWTVTCYSRVPDSKGMLTDDLFWKLEDNGRPAWIDGRDLWEAYEGVESLGRVVLNPETE